MAARKRPARLGRGLSSLMAQPVPVSPGQEESPAETPVAPPVVEADSQEDARDGSGSPAKSKAARPSVKAEVKPGKQAEAAMEADFVSDDGAGAASDEVGAGDRLRYIAVSALHANRHQPRQQFDEQALGRLSQSIKDDGLMQPIVVRPAQEGGQADGQAYEIVAGERRWRAAKLAGLEVVPAIVRELDDQQLAEWALIENLQREDLNPIERAEAFRNLVEKFQLSHDDVAQRVGVERSTISNLLRLLNLDESVQDMLRAGQLVMGQARAIAGLSDPDQQRQVAQRAVKQGLSVRQVEQLVRALSQGEAAAGEPAPKRVRSAYLADLEQQIAEQLSTKVKIRPGRKKGSGTLTIDFYSLDQFDALIGRMGVSTE